MPTYEYVCRDCGHHLEVVQSFRDDPLTTCSNCAGSLRKVFSAAGIIFKGSGYYVTDTRARTEGSGGEGKDRGKAAGGEGKDRGKAAGGEGKDRGKAAGGASSSSDAGSGGSSGSSEAGSKGEGTSGAAESA